MKRAKIHQEYITTDGRKVPSVTTILQVLAKPALIHWAWKLGTQGLDYRKYRDEFAEIGSLAHKMILCDLSGEKIDTSDYTKNQIDQAENCFISYLEWKKNHDIEPVLVEEPLVSDVELFGGTPDFFGLIDGQYTIIDFKTGSDIYDQYWYQLAGYDILLLEKGMPADVFKIVRIGREEDEAFEEQTKTNLEIEKQIFLSAKEIYFLMREGKNGDDN